MTRRKSLLNLLPKEKVKEKIMIHQEELRANRTALLT